jgi:hypothetical protein
MTLTFFPSYIFLTPVLVSGKRETEIIYSFLIAGFAGMGTWLTKKRKWETEKCLRRSPLKGGCFRNRPPEEKRKNGGKYDYS